MGVPCDLGTTAPQAGATGTGSLKSRLSYRLNAALERYFPERRLFLKSDVETRFIRLRPATQLVAITGTTLVFSWTVIATAVLLMDWIGSGSARDQAVRQQANYETRLNALSADRDARAAEAHAAQERFNLALAEVSAMQGRLLSSEDRRRELETGIEVIQSTLRRTMHERDAARGEVQTLVAEANGGDTSRNAGVGPEELAATVAFLTEALTDTAGARERSAEVADQARHEAEELALELRLIEERNERIFAQLEEAVTVSLDPLDKMFRSAGLEPDRILEEVRRGYSGQGGPLTPISLSTKGSGPEPDALRANSILERLDEMNLYRIAVQKAPFAMPVQGAFRFTSGFGNRRDPKGAGNRMHEGTDFAGATGTPIVATADGVVTHAGWQGGYGRLVKIQHAFGIETRYAHMSQIRVKSGDRVSRGDRIGDMGNTGRSTGTHLHYEIRLGATATNPMTYIRAARDVF
jgi:murein DD-endopeptidase MepM/ murein hydrolase activator NlpD